MRPLPPAEEGCDIAELHENLGTVLEPAVANMTMVKGIFRQSPDLQRRVCAFYWHDFVCTGYELPPACQAPTSEWLDDAMNALLEDRPLSSS